MLSIRPSMSSLVGPVGHSSCSVIHVNIDSYRVQNFYTHFQVDEIGRMEFFPYQRILTITTVLFSSII